MFSTQPMDEIIFNIISALLSATGILGAFTSFSAPEINKTYYGHNHFQIKAGLISTTYTWVFAILAAIGILAQIVKDLFLYDLPARTHGTGVYIRFICFALAAMAVLSWSLVMLGRFLAKRLWLPRMVESQRNAYQIAQFIGFSIFIAYFFNMNKRKIEYHSRGQ